MTQSNAENEGVVAICRSILIVLWAAAAVIAGVVGSVPMSLADSPNIIIIVADDLGYSDVLFNPLHADEVVTPHLEALANQSVVCRQGYVTGNVCSSTRAGLMTGQYQQRWGLYSAAEAGTGLPKNAKILPEYFKPAGYVSGLFGKWHLGPTLEWSPALRGFDEFFGFLGRGAHDYFRLDDPDDPIYRGTTVVSESGYLTDRLGEESVDFIERNKAERFFLCVTFNAVHAPLQAPEEEVAKFDTGVVDRNKLLAMGKRMDDAIGKIIDKLKQEGLWGNTLLFFVNDNGGPLRQTAQNKPLRGGKLEDYEGGIRIPFLVCWPDKLKPGFSDAVVSSLDILATALAAAGLEKSDSDQLDGIDLLPILSGKAPIPQRDLFWCSGSDEGWWAVRSGDWKLVGHESSIELFDLANDVSENLDLAKEKPEKVAALMSLHDAWLEQMAAPLFAGAKRFDPANPVNPNGWRAVRGSWESREGGLWTEMEPNDSESAMVKAPAVFTEGQLSFEFQFTGDCKQLLRLKDENGNGLLRVDFGPKKLNVIDLTVGVGEVLKVVRTDLETDVWHKLILRFRGDELEVIAGDYSLTVQRAIFKSPKSEATLLIFDGEVGYRNFSVSPN